MLLKKTGIVKLKKPTFYEIFPSYKIFFFIRIYDISCKIYTDTFL